MTVIEKKTDLQKNQIHHLKDTMIMYGIYKLKHIDSPKSIQFKAYIMSLFKGENLCRKVDSTEATLSE